MWRALLAASWCLTAGPSGWAQPTKNPPLPPGVTIEQPDANATKDQLSRLLEHYPPTLRNVLALDPSLLSNDAFLAPYPALVELLKRHPEIVRSPEYYVVGDFRRNNSRQDTTTSAERIWERSSEEIGIIIGFAMAIGLLTWLIRTTIDYRRWNRLTKVQTDVHTKILDRFTGSEELLGYIKSPAGAKFLESTPIALEAAPKSIGAPLGRILWSVQAGLVLAAGGIGLEIVGGRVAYEAAQPIQGLGVLSMALGGGFIASAIVSWMISNRLGLIEPSVRTARTEPPATLG
jgi:hypothetical protein